MSGQDKVAQFVAAHRRFWPNTPHVVSVNCGDYPARRVHLERQDLEDVLSEVRGYRERLANGDSYLAAAQMKVANLEREIDRLNRIIEDRMCP